MNKVFLGGAGIVLAILLFTGIYAFFGHEERRSYDVELREDGFSPSKLTVQKGDTVNFSTTRNKPFWPASDLHPSHGIYPEFDPKTPIDPKANWSFRFDREGEWKYHDHLYSAYRGSIVVSDDGSMHEIKPDQDARKDATCSEKVDTPECWQSSIDAALRKNGLNAAFTLIAGLYAEKPVFAAECHGYTHTIGKEAYRIFAEGWHVDLTPKTSYCGYGFYHGFMEALLQSGEEADRASEFCAYVGQELADKTTDGEGACYHGIGHGSVDGGDPRDWGDAQRMIAPGVELCERISGPRPESGALSQNTHLYRCVTGAFNAIELLSMDAKYKLDKFLEDPFWLCPSQPESYQEACYSNMIPALLRHTAGDFSKSAKRIEDIPEKNGSYAIRAIVISGLFHEFIRTNLYEPTLWQDGIAMCRTLSSRARLSCIEGLSGGHMKYGEPEKEYVKGFAFCATSQLNEEERSMCYEYILSRLRIWYTREKSITICDSVPELYRKYCQN